MINIKNNLEEINKNLKNINLANKVTLVAVSKQQSIDKIIQAIKGTYQPVSQAIYPYISRQISIDRLKGMRKLRIVGGIVLLSNCTCRPL